MRKALMHVAARGGAEEKLVDRLLEEAERASASVRAAAVLRAVRKDLLGARAPFRATLELCADDGSPPEAIVDLMRGLAARVDDVAHPDLSTALFGREHAIVPSGPMPVRYQYLMRRRRDFSHERYLERYLDGHAEFGRRTPGVAGYVQVHLDLSASAALAEAAGFGIWRVDSVSELHMASLADFVAAVAKSPVASEGPRDEEAFVDRANSVGFSSDTVQRFAAPPR